MRLTPRLLACFSLVFGLTTGAAVASEAPPRPNPSDGLRHVLRGVWSSTGFENEGTHHATRQFRFGRRNWGVVYRAYADAAGRQPLFRIDVEGVYVVGGPSATVSGAHEGIFPATSRRLTALSPAGVDLFAGMSCTLVVGQPKPLVDEGCGFLAPLMQAMGEYDLLALREGRLYLGDRAGDLSKRRPSALTPHPLQRGPLRTP